MGRKKKRRTRPERVGAPPGTLSVPEDAVASKVRVTRYDATSITEREGVDNIDQGPKGVVWVDVVGLGSLDVLTKVSDRFGLHPLAMEDVVSTHQRAKAEDYPKTLFVVLRAIREVDKEADLEQMSFFIGEGFVVTFQEREGDAFEPVRERLRAGKGRIRTQGATYLAYALLDATIDAMFPLLETYGDRIEALERDVFHDPRPDLAESIHALKNEVMRLRRTVLPLREALSRLMRLDNPLVDEDVRLYLRDCLDHLTQMVELLESQREMATTLVDAHLSSLGHRSNEVMKVLTMVATIFIPLSFLAGIYGMNFDASASPYNMPELGFAYGYPTLIAVMLAVACGMLVYFRRKDWL